MTTYTPLRDVPAAAGYGPGDVFVLFGELFGRGYANGIVDEARKAGMTIVGATVGRRDNNGPVRPLTAEELAEAEANLGERSLMSRWKPVSIWSLPAMGSPRSTGSRG